MVRCSSTYRYDPSSRIRIKDQFPVLLLRVAETDKYQRTRKWARVKSQGILIKRSAMSSQVERKTVQGRLINTSKKEGNRPRPGLFNRLRIGSNLRCNLASRAPPLPR